MKKQCLLNPWERCWGFMEVGPVFMFGIILALLPELETW